MLNLKTDLGCIADGIADDAPAIQTGINTGEALYAPQGRYVCRSPLSYVTGGYKPGLRLYGDGPDRTTFYHRGPSDAAWLTLDGGLVPYQAQRHGELRGFTVAYGGSPERKRGIDVRANWYLDLSHLYISGMGGDGIRMWNPAGDEYANGHCEMVQCEISRCGGWAVRSLIGTPKGGGGDGPLCMRNCRLIYNGGAVLWLGFSLLIECCGVAMNGNGIICPAAEPDGHPVMRPRVVVTGCEIDSNSGDNLYCESTSCVRIMDNRISAQVIGSTPAAATCVRLGGRLSMAGVSIEDNTFRVAPAVRVHSAIVIEPSVRGARLMNNSFPAYPPHLTKYDDRGLRTEIREDGLQLKMPPPPIPLPPSV